MKLDDRLLGAVLIGFGALVFWRAQSFPIMAGLPYGPGLFPSIAATGMMACGAVIALTGQLARSAAPRHAARAGDDRGDDRSQAEPAAPGAAAEQTASDRGEPVGRAAAARMAGVAAIVAAVALALDPLGFHVTAAAAVAATALIFGRGPLGAALLGVVSAAAAHAVFYSVLRVPLPWGLMEPVAW